MDKNTMSLPVNVKNIPVHSLCCGNIIVYLDHLWEVIRIEESSTNTHVNFHAKRQINQLSSSTLSTIDQDILHFIRIPSSTITIVEIPDQINTAQ